MTSSGPEAATPPVLVVDVGSSSVRVIVFDSAGNALHEAHESVALSTPTPGLVELDADALRDSVLRLVQGAADLEGIGAVGIANQRATTVAWDAETGRALGPALSWQDLRTVGRCLELQSEGIRVAPNAMPTKAEWLLAQSSSSAPRLGTIDSWVAWVLSDGTAHVTDASNASVSAMTDDDVTVFDLDLAARFGIPPEALAGIVASSGVAVSASVVAGAPPIAGIIGDQQASLVGQACTSAGQTKITFGTGAMLDTCTGSSRVGKTTHGTVPMVAWRSGTTDTHLVEALLLAAGSCVSWLVDLGVLASVGDADSIAASVPDTGGVTFVPALQGLATPRWDHGARGTLLGLTRGTTAAHVVRAVLDGVACTAADLVAAASADTGVTIDRVRVDGGMTANRTFVSLLASALGVPVDVSPHREATAWGAALLAGAGAGVWPEPEILNERWRPAETVVPTTQRTASDLDRWEQALDRSRAWIPELSGFSF